MHNVYEIMLCVCLVCVCDVLGWLVGCIMCMR